MRESTISLPGFCHVRYAIEEGACKEGRGLSFFERMSPLDGSFLWLEAGDCPITLGGLSVIEGGSALRSDGSVNIELVRDWVGRRIHQVPRLRQKIAMVPFQRSAVWVEDDEFDLENHVKPISVRRPGDERALDELVELLLARPLDRRRPLWEIWCVEGLEEGRFALVSKVHHCAFDGVSATAVFGVLLDQKADPDPMLPDVWHARPAPSAGDLLLSGIADRLSQPARAVRAVGRVARSPVRSYASIRPSARSLWSAAQPLLQPASRTPMNVAVGSDRRFERAEAPLEEIKTIKKHLGGTVNDVILAITAGGLRRFLDERAGGAVSDDLDIRALVPVSLRQTQAPGEAGNQVSELIVPLHVDEADPVERLHAITRTTQELKNSRPATIADAVGLLGELGTPEFVAWVTRAVVSRRAYSLIVTNVPGPPFPLYFTGGRLLRHYPIAPVLPDLALIVGVFSYDGLISWGLTADADAFPDLERFAKSIDEERSALERLTATRSAQRT